MRYATLLAALVFACLFGAGPVDTVRAETPAPYQYVAPLPGATLVSPRTTIAVRPGEILARASLSDNLFVVEGTRTGGHTGQVLLADDNKTVVFRPARPFAPGEIVTVTVRAGLTTAARRVLPGFQFDFTIWPDETTDPYATEWAQTWTWPLPTGGAVDALSAAPLQPTALPVDYPMISITLPATSTNEGYIFLSNLSDYHSYLLILDPTSGDPVYYQRMEPSRKTLDFKRQPNGLLTYYDSLYGVFYAMDDTYKIVRTYAAGNGYRADHHDLQVLPDGHYLLFIWDWRTMDLSKVVPGGKPKALVVGLIVQELDASDLVVFEWRSWDHIAITETTEDLTAQRVNYTHGNAIERDYDGNILISARNLDQIIKLNRQTGEMMWRLGGQKNDFTLLDDVQFFHRQHDIRRLPNGHITLFDNRSDLTPYYSRAVEYALDETAKTATRVWEYRNTPDVYAAWLANVQRLPSGNTLIGWGLESPAATQVGPDGEKQFEFSFRSSGEGSYRVFRFPWVGRPTWPPALAFEKREGRAYLSFSWNGATEIAGYRVLGGVGLTPDTLIATKERTGFATSLDITEAAMAFCSFQVMPLDREGRETTYSNVVYAPRCFPYTSYLPLTARP